jgi:hypothetical protein
MAGVEGAAGLDLGAFLTSNTRVRALLVYPESSRGAGIIKVRDAILR